MLNWLFQILAIHMIMTAWDCCMPDRLIFMEICISPVNVVSVYLPITILSVVGKANYECLVADISVWNHSKWIEGMQCHLVYIVRRVVINEQ